MNRYVVVKGISERVGGESDSGGVVRNVRWQVVDLTTFVTLADCGDSQTTANKVASALNALDGGPL